MSLINDALRRARQQTVLPAADQNLQLRPMEAPPSQGSNSGLLLLGVFVAGLMLAGAVVPLLFRWTRSAEPVLAQQTTPVVVDAPPAAVATPEPPPDPAAAVIVPGPTNSMPAIPANPAVTIEAPVVRLQGILFHTTRPSAIVNGKTVHVGDRVAGYSVTSISADTVVLVSESETNVLHFGEE